MEIIHEHFKNLTDKQINRFKKLKGLYNYWNEMINVISRQDIENLYVRHVLHSLAIAKVIQFAPGTSVIDVGTGGGFPGIPLAILFPDVNFYLVDPVKRKIKVVSAIIDDLGLTNVVEDRARNIQVKKKFDFVISRAVSKFPKFVRLTSTNLHNHGKNSIPNGILYLKGGDFDDEIEPFKEDVTIYELNNFFNDAFFETKKLIYLPFEAIQNKYST